jgi:hypothetical protein
LPLPKGGTVIDQNRAYVRLKLHDLTIIDQFVCFSEYGMEAEPAHRVLVHAKGNYAQGSDKLELNGQQIPLDTIQIKGVFTKEDCFKSHARLGIIDVYMIDHVFRPFVELLRRYAHTGEMIVKLEVHPHKQFPDMLSLSFGGMDITCNAGVSINEQTLAETLHASLSAQLKSIRTLLLAIAVMTGLIVIHILFK